MAKIYYARIDEFWRKEQKYDFLEQQAHSGQVAWQTITPDRKHNWLTAGLSDEFDTFIPIGTKEGRSAKSSDIQAIFKTFSLGVSTNRDGVVYDFNRQALESRIEQFCENYNAETLRYQQKGKPTDIDNFVSYTKVQWSSTLKSHAKRGTLAKFDSQKIRTSLYRPFTSLFLYYDSILNDRPAFFQQVFPNLDAETKNRVICVTDKASEKPFLVLMSDQIPDMHVVSPGSNAQCFPFYTYDEDGTNRQENITDWALEQFRARYGQPRPEGFLKPFGSTQDDAITKWDIFHYVYALLHHPTYRTTYAANLRRELPRIPFVDDFWGFAQAGARLAELHVNYEQQPEYQLKFIENPAEPLNWHVEKMRLSKDKTQIKYNEFLTLAGIPPEVFEYKLGNRSALDW
jgi:predicted helicase